MKFPLVIFRRFLAYRGFTLVELMVVIGIIALLAGMSVVAMNTAREKAREAKALSEVDTMAKAINLLSADTGKWPSGCPIEATANPEVDLNTAAAGLTQRPEVRTFDTGCFWSQTDVDNWNGPYVKTTIDPWGHPYIFDPDYYPRQGCHVSGVLVQPVVLSFGRNGTGMNTYDCDDVFKIMK
jgi:prepilin-type N-terminal cleavage/methylation domain-containing protein